MKNKLYLFAFSFIMMFIGINSANALECYYETLVLKDGTVTRGGTANYHEQFIVEFDMPATCPNKIYTNAPKIGIYEYHVYTKCPQSKKCDDLELTPNIPVTCVYFTKCGESGSSVYVHMSANGVFRVSGVENAQVSGKLNNGKCPDFLSVKGNAYNINDTSGDYVSSNTCSPNSPMPGTISCGGGMIKNLGRRIPKITSTLVDIIKITIPILLVIFGTIDILKGVTSQKEDEIKKGVTSFVKKLVIGVVVFLLVAITQLLVDLITPADSKNIIDCMNCFLNYDC